MHRVPAAKRLFDPGPRTDRSPSSRSESRFAFLNRVDRPYFAIVRDLLEEWFRHVPPRVQAGIRRRFRQDDAGQHVGAFWELFLHEAHRRLGFTIEFEPSVPGTERRPDFLLERDGNRHYLEATLVGYSNAEIARRQRQDRLLDMVDSAFDADFYVTVRVAVAGTRTPRRRAIVDPIETWLAGLSWSSAWKAAQAREWEAPERTFRAAGSVVTLEAHPKPPHARYDRKVRMIWAGPAEGGVFDESGPILKDLRAKAKAYGRPDAPYVIAALCTRDFATSNDIEQALYGREVVQVPIDPAGGPAGEVQASRDFNGLWQRGQAQRYTRVSGVLGAFGVAPWSVAEASIILWLNPWASRPLDVDLPWRTVRGDLEANALVGTDAAMTLHELFRVPPEWPQPGGPFDD